MTPALSISYLESPFATLTIDLVGSKVNILSTSVWNQLETALTELAQRTDLKGLLVLSGKPGIFIAGADLKELESANPAEPEPTRRYLELGNRVLRQLESLPYPTVALIDGACLGGGLEVALACDFRLIGTHPRALVGFPEVMLGLIPGWGGTQRTARMCGPFEALQFVCAGSNYAAQDAIREGLVHEMVPSERLIARAKELLQESERDASWQRLRRIKSEPMRAELNPSLGLDEDKTLLEAMLSYMKQLEGPARAASTEAVEVIFHGSPLPLEGGLRIETAAFLRLAGSAESKMMIEAFFAKKK